MSIQAHVLEYEKSKYKASQEEFDKWAKKHRITIKTEHEELKAGQRIYFKNGNGVPMVFKILGFIEPDIYGNCILLDWDCFWAPIPTSRIIKVIDDEASV